VAGSQVAGLAIRDPTPTFHLCAGGNATCDGKPVAPILVEDLAVHEARRAPTHRVR